MKTLNVVVLVVALGVASWLPATAQTSGTSGAAKASPRVGSLQEQIRKGMPDRPGNTAGHVIHYILEGIEGVEVGLAIYHAGAVTTAVSALALEIASPIVGTAALWVALGNAHADAINSVMSDQMLSGFSRGVVLGADRRSADFVKSNFVKWSKVPHAVYPEYGAKFQQAYNSALVAGYSQGQRLTKEESGAFFSDLFSRMKVHPSVTYGKDSKQWSERSWVDYYVETAAIFRRDHLK